MGWGTPCNASEFRRYQLQHGKENVGVRREGSLWILYIRGERQGVGFGSDCTKPCGDCYNCTPSDVPEEYR